MTEARDARSSAAKLVRQFRRAPDQISDSHMIYARCIGNSINNAHLEGSQILGSRLKRLRQNSTKVLHVHIFNDTVNCFVFDFGCVVIWGCSRRQLASAIEALLPWTDSPRARPTEISVLFKTRLEREGETDNHLSCILGDSICLSTDSVLERLSYSYALAQGTVLDVYEATLAERIEAIGDAPSILFETGKLHLTEKETSVRLGEIFLLQYSVNLKSDLLESPPDTFWDLDPLAPVYRLCRSYLDLDRRVATVNQKLDYMRNLWSLFQNEAHEKTHSLLGWIITIGVAGELFVAALQMWLEIYRFKYS